MVKPARSPLNIPVQAWKTTGMSWYLLLVRAAVRKPLGVGGFYPAPSVLSILIRLSV